MSDNKIYDRLVAYGHSAFKAAEIVLDAQRGDKHANDWIRAVCLEPEKRAVDAGAAKPL